jgi:hypothetical protein
LRILSTKVAARTTLNATTTMEREATLRRGALWDGDSESWGVTLTSRGGHCLDTDKTAGSPFTVVVTR